MAKTFNNLFPAICSLENLTLAANKTGNQRVHGCAWRGASWNNNNNQNNLRCSNRNDNNASNRNNNNGFRLVLSRPAPVRTTVCRRSGSVIRMLLECVSRPTCLSSSRLRGKDAASAQGGYEGSNPWNVPSGFFKCLEKRAVVFPTLGKPGVLYKMKYEKAYCTNGVVLLYKV